MKTIIDNSKIDEILPKYKGAFAQIWLFGITHKKLIIRLTMPNENRKDIKDALYILGISCEYIQGPFSWANSDIKIKEEIDIKTKKVTFRMEDTAINFKLECIGGIGLAIGPESEIDHSFDDFLRK